MYRWLLLLLLLFSSGCPALRDYNTLEFLPSDSELVEFKKITGNNSILSQFFTAEAQIALAGISVVDGIMIKPFVIGVNGWSRFAGVITLNGFDKRVVISKNYMKTATINTVIHEYIHHLDAMDRAGEGEWISHREFAIAFHRLMQDPNYRNTSRSKLNSSDSFITNVFGIGPLSELIAYTGAWVAEGNGPIYMRYVFRNILKRQNEEPPKVVALTRGQS